MGNICSCCCCASKTDAVIPPAGPTEKLIEKQSTPLVTNESTTTYNVLSTNSEVHETNVVVLEATRVPASPAPSSSPSGSNKSARLSTPVSIKVDPEDRPEDPAVVARSPPMASLMPRVLSPKHRALSTRSSFIQTKEHREFRFFLPILEASDDFLSEEQTAAYNAALELVKKTFNTNLDEEDTEVRDDTYLIGRSYFGLKYRDDGKLEMRVKTDNKPIWQERWNKVRFGKKSMGHYRTDILTYLSDVGYKDPSNERFIDEPRFITIHKRRDVDQLDAKVSVEVAELTIAEKQLSELKCEVKRRKWLTVSIEGDNTAIEGLAYQHISSGSGVWGIFSLWKELFEAHAERAVASHFVPVISGYPLWIEVIGNTFDTPDSVKQEIFPAMDAFAGFLTAE